MRYTREMLEEKLLGLGEPWWSSYKNPILNYRGRLQDGTLYTEILAALILENNVPELISKSSRALDPRELPYWQEGQHTGVFRGMGNVLNEKRMAIALYNKFNDKEKMGNEFQILDYQTPLKRRQHDDARGEIDLLAKDNNGKLCLIELKPPTSKETLLRAGMEIYTYGEFVEADRNIFFKTFKVKYKGLRKIVLMKKSELGDHGGQPNLYELLKRLNIEVYSYSCETWENHIVFSSEKNRNLIRPKWMGVFTVQAFNQEN
jgi:hypothetical protein